MCAALDAGRARARFVLARRHCLDRATHDLGYEGGGVDREPGPEGDELRWDLRAAGDVEAGELRVFDVRNAGGEQASCEHRQHQGPRSNAKRSNAKRSDTPRLDAQAPDERRRQQQGRGEPRGERTVRLTPHEVGQTKPADVEQEAAGQHDALARRRQALQDGDIPEDDLDQLRGVANELHEDERDVAKEPVHRQPHDADEQPMQRRRDDAHGGHQHRVQQADQQRARIGVEVVKSDERMSKPARAPARNRSLNSGARCRRASMQTVRQAPRRPAGRPTGRSRQPATGDGSSKRHRQGSGYCSPPLL